ncbi:MAG: (2,3-dihydroxybenzoyl)adenylate synthase [Mycobacterium sp.]
MTGSMTGFEPFPDQRAQAYRAAGYWEGLALDTAILRSAAGRWPDRTAVLDQDTSLTYRELDESVDRAAAGLHALGVSPGDRMVLQLPNRCSFAVALFSLLRAGAIPIMCLPGHRIAELSHFVEVADAVGVIVADTAAGFDYRTMAGELGQRHRKLRHLLIDGDPGPYTPWSQIGSAAGAVPDPARDTSQPALLLVSGGTTGAPKLIPRTHDDYVYNITASARLCRLTPDDVYLVSLPAGHNFPLACPGLLGAMSVGATIVFGSDPSPEAAFGAITERRVTVTALVPALARVWAQACEWEPQRPTTLRLLQVGGAKLSPGDAHHIRATLTPGLQQVFGMAEGLLCFTRLDDPPDLVCKTQGRPLSTADEVRIVDDADYDVAPGEEGELLVRGPYTLNGYFRAERDNARAFSPQGFYRTGDRVRQLSGGYVEVTGRIKDVIHRAGETVSAPDLEAHLLTHPEVWAAAVVPIPDDYLGEKICAAVVFKSAPVSLAELNAQLDSRGMGAHSRPDMLVPMPSLPTTAVGKIDKQSIAAKIIEQTQRATK